MGSRCCSRSDGDDRPTDARSLSFAQIDLSYKPQNPDGSVGIAVTGGWDVVLGKPRWVVGELDDDRPPG